MFTKTEDLEMIVMSLAALLIVFAVGCASEKALNRGCASSTLIPDFCKGRQSAFAEIRRSSVGACVMKE